MNNMKNSKLIELIEEDLIKIGLIGSTKIAKELNVTIATWWRLTNRGAISNNTLKKISYITKRPYSEYKKLKED